MISFFEQAVEEVVQPQYQPHINPSAINPTVALIVTILITLIIAFICTKKGILGVIFSFLGRAASIIVAIAFCTQFAIFLDNNFMLTYKLSESVPVELAPYLTKAIAIIGLYIIARIVFMIVRLFVRKIGEAKVIAPINKGLGFVVGLVGGYFISMALLTLITNILVAIGII